MPMSLGDVKAFENYDDIPIQAARLTQLPGAWVLYQLFVYLTMAIVELLNSITNNVKTKLIGLWTKACQDVGCLKARFPDCPKSKLILLCFKIARISLAKEGESPPSGESPPVYSRIL
jgi:hypothetical protein